MAVPGDSLEPFADLENASLAEGMETPWAEEHSILGRFCMSLGSETEWLRLSLLDLGGVEQPSGFVPP